MKATSEPPMGPVSTLPASPDAGTARKEIVVAIDFSEESAATLRQAASLAAKEGAHLTVLNVVGEPGSFRSLDTVRMERRERLEHRLKLRALTRQELGPDSGAQLTVSSGEPAEEIAKVAAQQHASLVVVGRHHHGSVSRWWHGHTASRVIRCAPCPVMVLN